MSSILIKTQTNLETIIEKTREDPMEEVMVPVSAIEVKRAYLLANAFKEFINSGNFSQQDMRKEYGLLKNMIGNLDRPAIDDKIYTSFPRRLKEYNLLHWYKGKVNLAEMGVWPRMGHIDIKICQNNLTDTAEKIQQVKEEKLDLYVPEKVFDKIDSITEKIHFIKFRFPLILFPGGKIRGRSHGERTNSKDNSDNHTILKKIHYDIDDGNNRAVSYSLYGLKYAPAYIGMRDNEQNEDIFRKTRTVQ